MKLLAVVMLLSTACSPAWSGNYEWTSGWGMGVTEYLVDDGNDNALVIACPDYDDAISASAVIEGQRYSSKDLPGFDVIVDGEVYQNPFNTDCRVCGGNFRNAFWEALRAANNLKLTADGVTVRLPTQGLKETLLSLDDPGNSCRSAW